jgi:hypothetical protein
MGAPFGKLEYRITVPTAGYTATVGSTKTIPAGTYYLSSPGSGSNDFLAEVQSQFGATSVTASLGEYGTGIVTITFSGSTDVSWISTELRDILGFTGNLSGASSYVGTLSARGVWMPNVPPMILNAGGHWRGHREADYRTAVNPAGYVWAVHGQSRTALDLLRWTGIQQARTWIQNESTTNQSLERFWTDGVWGEAAWGTPGGPIRWYPSAASDTEFGTYKVVDGGVFRPTPVVEGWIALWTWQMPKMIQVPGSESTGVS